jgi:hypothetical protein
MTRSRFVVFTALVVVAVGIVAAVGALVLDPARAAVGPLPAEALNLPGDARFVMGLDVKRFAASPFYRKYATSGKPSRPDAFKHVEEKLGLVPERDLDQIVFAGRGGTKDTSSAVALVLGTFDRAKLSRAIETEKKGGVTWKSQHGTTVYLFNEGARGTIGVAFLDDHALLLGSAAAIEATLSTRAQGQQPLRANVELVSLLERVKPGSTFWMVGDQTLLSNMPKSIPAPGAAAAGSSLNLPALKSLVVAGDLEPEVSVSVTGDTSDETAAKSLADLVRGFVALASLQAGQKPELKQLASAISVSTDQSRVLVNARVPYELIESLSTAPVSRRGDERGAEQDTPAPAPARSPFPPRP